MLPLASEGLMVILYNRGNHNNMDKLQTKIVSKSSPKTRPHCGVTTKLVEDKDLILGKTSFKRKGNTINELYSPPLPTSSAVIIERSIIRKDKNNPIDKSKIIDHKLLAKTKEENKIKNMKIRDMKYKRLVSQMGDAEFPSYRVCSGLNSFIQDQEISTIDIISEMPLLDLNHKLEVEVDPDLIDAITGLGNSLRNREPIQVKMSDLGKFSDSLSSIADTGIKVDTGNNFISIIEKIISSFKDSLPQMLILIIIIVLICTLPAINDSKQRWYIISMLALIGVTYGGLREYIFMLVEYLTTGPGLKSQGPDDTLAVLVSGIFNMYMFGTKCENIFKIEEVHKVLVSVGKATPTVKNIVASITIVVEYVRGVIFEWYRTKDGKDAYALTGHPFIDSFLEEANKIREDYENKEIYGVQSSLDRVKNCILEGEKIRLRLPGTSEYVGLRMGLNNCISELEKIRKALLATNFQFSGIRQEPVSILMRGPPGCGKSLSMQHMAHAIAAVNFNEKDYLRYKEQPSSFVYNRQVENVFWEGYDTNKRILFLDDILQVRDIAGEPDNEAMSIIRAINVFENMLHCAAIENKGNTTFRSDFVIANTNLATFNLESIHDVGAFMRRWNIVLDVVPKAEFCVDSTLSNWEKRIDLTKLPTFLFDPSGKETTELHYDQLEFHVQVWKGGNTFHPTGIVLDFEGVINLVNKKFAEKKIWHKKYLVRLEETLAKFRVQHYGDIKSEVGESSSSVNDTREFSYSEFEDSPFDKKFLMTLSLKELDLAKTLVQSTRVSLMDNYGKYYTDLEISAVFLLALENSDFSSIFSNELKRYPSYGSDAEILINKLSEIIIERDNLIKEKSYFENALEKTKAFLNKIKEAAVFLKNTPRYIWADRIWLVWITFGQFWDGTYTYKASIALKKMGIWPWNNMSDSSLSLSSGYISWIGRSLVIIKVTNWIIKGIMWFYGYELDKKTNLFIKKGTYSRVIPYSDISHPMWRDEEFLELMKLDAIPRKDMNYLDLYRWEYLHSWFVPPSIKEDMEKTNVYLSADPVYDSRGKTVLSWEPWLRLKKAAWQLEKTDSYDAFLEIMSAEMELKDKNPDRLLTWSSAESLFMPEVAYDDDHTNKIWLLQSSERIQKIKRTRVPVKNVKLFQQSNVKREKVNRNVVRLHPKKMEMGDIECAENLNLEMLDLPLASESIAGNNINLDQIMKSVVRNNVYEFMVPSSNNPGMHARYGFCIAICGRTLIMPLHFLTTLEGRLTRTSNLKKTDLVVLKKVDATRVDYIIDIKTLLSDCVWIKSEKYKGGDIAICRMPREFQPSRDIRNYFVKEKTLELYKRIPAVLLIPMNLIVEDGGLEEKERHWMYADYLTKPLRTTRNGDLTGEQEISRSFAYPARTSGGDCGALLFADDHRNSSPFLGFHVAGSFNKEVPFGVATVVSYENVLDILSLTGETYTEEGDEIVHLEFVNECVENMIIEGKLSKGEFPYSTGESKIMKSPLYGKWGEARKDIARLRSFVDGNGLRIDPLVKARNKYCHSDIYIPDRIVVAARISLQAHLYSSARKHIYPRLFTFEEAILGDNSDSFKPIPRVTSAGYPYNISRGIRSRERFFGTGEKYSLNNVECGKLREEVFSIIDRAREGIRSFHVFVDCVKDELRSKSKVANGESRLFSAGPTPLLIVHRMYFGAFQKWLFVNSIHNGMVITINEYSTDWDIMTRQLLRFGEYGDNIGAGDYKGFDMCEHPRLHYAILDIINEWYPSSEDSNIRAVLWLEVVNSRHINGDLLMRWGSSLPSGHGGTIWINCLYNHLCFRLSWIDRFVSCSDFNTNCVLMVTGDDNVFSVSDKYKKHFCEKNVADSMLKLGMTYVPEDKEKLEFEETLRNIDDVTFLKRKFLFDRYSRLWIAPLDLDTILEIPYWVKKGATHLSDTAVNVNIALEELSLHSSEVFDKWSKLILKSVLEVPGIQYPTNIEYYGLRQMVLYRGSIPPIDYYLNDLYSEIRLQGSSNEFLDGKEDAMLISERSRAFQLYCQGGMVAALPIPRNQDRESDLARSLLDVCANDTTLSNDGKHELSNSLLNNNGTSTFITQRTGDNSTSFNSGGTTGATNEAEVPSSAMVQYSPLSVRELNSPSTGVIQEVRNFLSKPVLFNSGSFATTDTITTYFYFDRVAVLWKATDLWKNKLAGNLAFRGTIVITLYVNASRFQQGRYILGWIPDGGGYNDSGQALLVAKAHTATLVQRTQIPHVEVDLSCDTSAVLEIPLVNCIGWIPLVSNADILYGNGYLILVPYSPLVAASGLTTAGYSLYAHWKDVEFTLPVVPQAGERAASKVISRKRIEDREAEAEGVGVVSGSLKGLSMIAGAMSNVPLISSVAGRVSWAADILSNTARAFGWSAPHDYSPTTRMARWVMPRYNNCDVVDVSTKLAVTDRANIEEVPGFAGSGVDELSIGYICSIPAYWTNYTWNTGQAEGTQIAYIAMSPRDFNVDYTWGAAGVLSAVSPLAWCSNFFNFYRGSIRMIFKLVKTEFHSGRLVVSFYPYDYIAQNGSAFTTMSLGNTDYLHREIIDVRCGNEFSFVIPYGSLTQYRPTFGNERMYGFIYIHVLNPLIAPSTVSSSVTILVENCGHTDMEFAFPRGLIQQSNLVVVPQAGETNICEIVSTHLGNSSTRESIAPSVSCMGERILSLRQLLKRYNSMIRNVNMTTDPTFQFYPFSIELNYVDAGNVSRAAYYSTDIYGTILSCFALARGGIRYKIINTSNQNYNLSAANKAVNSSTSLAMVHNFNFGTPFGTSTADGNGTNQTFVNTNISQALEIEFPAYCRSFAYPISDVIVNPTAGPAYDVRGVAPRSMCLVYCTSTPDVPYGIKRAVAEDFSAGLFISTLVMAGWSSSF